MPRLFQLTKMPQGDYRMLLTADSDVRQRFDYVLGADFYSSTVWESTRLMRPEADPEKFKADVVRQNPGSCWDEVRAGVWLWRPPRATAADMIS